MKSSAAECRRRADEEAWAGNGVEGGERREGEGVDVSGGEDGREGRGWEREAMRELEEKEGNGKRRGSEGEGGSRGKVSILKVPH
jgi:hypothetical protein